VCFVTELLLLLSNIGDNYQDKESLMRVYFVLHINRLERGTFPSVSLPVEYAVRGNMHGKEDITGMVLRSPCIST
jgi:hypothetical protein